MGTILQQISRRQAEEFSRRSYECQRMLLGTHNDLKFGVLAHHIVDQVFQKSRGIDIEDAYGWMLWISYVDAGKMYFGSIYVGSTPSPDKCVDENNEKLRTLSGAFDTEFWGGNYGHDGHLTLTADSFTLRNNVVLWENHSKYMEEIEGKNIVLPKGTLFPLEVGYYDPNRALETVISEKRLARWPYDHEYIYLFQLEP